MTKRAPSMKAQRQNEDLPPPPTEEILRDAVFNPRITYRLNVTSLEDSLDVMFERASGVIDFSDPKQKARFKLWLLHFCDILVSNMQMDFAKAATIGMEQMAKLIRDPRHRENVREKRMKATDAMKPELVQRVRATRRKKAAEERLKQEIAEQ